MITTFTFKKIKNVESPSRGTSSSAGVDFYVPNDIDSITLAPGQTALIPSGIIARIPKGHALIAFNKSGVSIKQGLQVMAQVVDEDYQGEIHLHVVNTTDVTTTIFPGQKLIQFILIPVNYENPMEVEDPWGEIETQRGTGMAGSTGLFNKNN